MSTNEAAAKRPVCPCVRLWKWRACLMLLLLLLLLLPPRLMCRGGAGGLPGNACSSGSLTALSPALGFVLSPPLLWNDFSRKSEGRKKGLNGAEISKERFYVEHKKESRPTAGHVDPCGSFSHLIINCLQATVGRLSLQEASACSAMSWKEWEILNTFACLTNSSALFKSAKTSDDRTKRPTAQKRVS